MENHIKVLKVEKNGIRTIIKEDIIKNELETFNDYLQGYIAVISAFPDGSYKGNRPISLVINDEGNYKPLAPSIGYARGQELVDYVVGNAIFVAVDDKGDFASLTEEEMMAVRQKYRHHGTLQMDEVAHHIIVYNG
ncbi:DUF3846 domain-containing protein [Rossellomorea marisflavi]|uniref:DUF3846 domain-containing protein n=1 Tax=Rossellomorea marisflavi TaxID=189381 RepID=UPI003F9F5D74